MEKFETLFVGRHMMLVEQKGDHFAAYVKFKGNDGNYHQAVCAQTGKYDKDNVEQQVELRMSILNSIMNHLNPIIDPKV